MYSIDLTGRIALVTGAGPNNGRAIAAALGSGGATVVASDLNAQHAEETAAAVVRAGGSAIAVPFDITDLDAVRQGVRRIESEVGPVDILVQNAGLPSPQPGHTGGHLGQFKDSDPSMWSRWIDINMYGSMNCIWSVLAGMVDRGWGRIVQISSASGSRGLPVGLSVYGASKAGIEGLLRHLAIEVADTGVRLNALALGSIETPGRPENDDTRLTFSRIPVHRRGRPDEVAGGVMWLCSDAGDYVTGQTVHVNGGTVHGR
jgi:NAD(P)-dependent dehydrogenase (short-subunit alcohol dehydrogenase family)